MKGVTESMPGRSAVLQLLPFSSAGHPNVSVVRGGFPEVIARPSAASLWFRPHIQTYLERDVETRRQSVRRDKPRRAPRHLRQRGARRGPAWCQSCPRRSVPVSPSRACAASSAPRGRGRPKPPAEHVPAT